MYICDVCPYLENEGNDACRNCPNGNPCLGCEDYDFERDICLSNGGCGRPAEE